MKLDLKKNELVFSGMNNQKEFRACLQAPKTIKFRERNGLFYVPMKHFHECRKALRDYKGQIATTTSYLQFAEKFVKPKGPIVIDWYPATCKIKGSGLPFDKIMPATSYFTKSAIRSPQYENGTWDGNVYLFNVLLGEFPSGLLERVIKILQESGVPFVVNQKFQFPVPYLNLNPVFEFTPTQDQLDATEALYRANNGIAKLPTGFGKTSFVAAALIARKGVRSVFLANQRVLIHDAQRDFQSVFRNDDVQIGMIGDGEFDPQDITVASIQAIVAALKPPTHLEIQQAEGELKVAEFRLSGDTSKDAQKELKKLSNRIKKLYDRIDRSKKIIQFLQTVDLFIVDESQVLGTEMWDKFLKACPAAYRYTLSATDTRTDGGRIQIVAATGERRYESSAEEQIQKGRLAEFKAYFKYFDHGLSKEVLKDLKISFHEAYRIFIIENRKRNEYLCDVMIDWLNQGFSIIGLVTWTDHADFVIEILNERGFQEGLHYEYVDGNTNKKKRKENIERFRNGEFPILLGTSIFDVGFNAKNASKIVRFNAGASEVRETQRAGRTVRMREDGSRGESIDIIDLNSPYFMSQGFKRAKLLKEEFGEQRVEMLPGKIMGDFDVSKLEEVANSTPDATDKEQMLDVINRIRFGDDYDQEDEEIVSADEVEEIVYDKDLLDLIGELQGELGDKAGDGR